MISGIVKTVIVFCTSYIVLSFQFNDAYLFEHMTKVTGPVGENIQIALSDGFERTWLKTKAFASQLFTNSEPIFTLEDEVGKTQSAVQKEEIQVIHNPPEHYLDELRREEREALSEIIQQN